VQGAPVVGAVLRNNDLSGLTGLSDNNDKLVNSGVGTTILGNKFGTNPLNGTFTAANNTLTTVTNNNASSFSKVRIMPTNAAAATLMGSAKSLYYDGYTTATSFKLRTADGNAATGTETFNYVIE